MDLDGSQVLPIANKTAVNDCAQVFYGYILSFILSRKKMTGEYGSYIFNFMRNFQTIFQNGCTISHFTSST